MLGLQLCATTPGTARSTHTHTHTERRERISVYACICQCLRQHLVLYSGDLELMCLILSFLNLTLLCVDVVSPAVFFVLECLFCLATCLYLYIVMWGLMTGMGSEKCFVRH